MTSMNISIPVSLRAFVEAQVAKHGYSSASEYVRELLRDARERGAKEVELRDLISLGLESLSRGESVELTKETLPKFLDDVKARARRRLSPKKPARRA
ncbi:MAG: type II toxin-antitoxin system ParD family antitoxin [Planctomycetes bacterium]|nr:type II toxin-antitoxin system ParD family antitoxin [Planctomycetota bacterium]